MGLAAYILEKFSTATDLEYRKLDDGGLEKDFTMDALLVIHKSSKLFLKIIKFSLDLKDNVMIYYLSNAMTTAVRLYSEAFGGLEYALSRVHTHVPFACARFKNEIMHQFDWIIEEKYRNLVQSNHFDHGGHFAALQLPNILYNDVLDFVKKTLR